MDTVGRCLVVGLGNPGKAYEKTRHNVGFMVLDRIAETYAIRFDKEKFNGLMGRGRIEGIDTLLVKPLSYMNRSGGPVRRIAGYFDIRTRDMVVVHDDIDLEFGRIKIKEKGGHGGHNGLRSLMDALGGGDFARLRIGIGRSEAGRDVVDHVLETFRQEEFKAMESIVDRSRDAVVSILCHGARESMNEFNRKIC